MSAPRRILLIDDNDDARELLGMGLQLKGHELAMASGGLEGLERVLEGDYMPLATPPLRRPCRHL